MIASIGLKRHSSLLCRRINSIHQGRGYQHVPLCPTTAEICTDECCAYTCVLNHPTPFPARTRISNFQPSLCKLLKASLLQNTSHPSGNSLFEGCSQPMGSAGGNSHSAGHNCTAACPAPPPDVNKTSSTGIQPQLPHPSDLTGQKHGGSPFSMGALQQIHGVEGSQQPCFKQSKLDALDDLHCSPALA